MIATTAVTEPINPIARSLPSAAPFVNPFITVLVVGFTTPALIVPLVPLPRPKDALPLGLIVPVPVPVPIVLLVLLGRKVVSVEVRVAMVVEWVVVVVVWLCN